MRTDIKVETTLILLLATASTVMFGHGNNDHPTQTVQLPDQSVLQKKIDSRMMAYRQINEHYLADIKPLFEKKCFDCHAQSSNYPWYYNIPGVKQMIDHDIKEAKLHLDMSGDFPFLSHETPKADLISLRKIGIEGGMPPLRYVIGHWDATLNDAERMHIINWTQRSIDLLEGVRHE